MGSGLAINMCDMYPLWLRLGDAWGGDLCLQPCILRDPTGHWRLGLPCRLAVVKGDEPGGTTSIDVPAEGYPGVGLIAFTQYYCNSRNIMLHFESLLSQNDRCTAMARIWTISRMLV